MRSDGSDEQRAVGAARSLGSLVNSIQLSFPFSIPTTLPALQVSSVDGMSHSHQDVSLSADEIAWKFCATECRTPQLPTIGRRCCLLNHTNQLLLSRMLMSIRFKNNCASPFANTRTDVMLLCNVTWTCYCSGSILLAGVA